jgi:hypothetical protein
MTQHWESLEWTGEDEATVAAQLQRPARGALGVVHRCPCGRPDVIATEPRLPDGTPFPTLYYVTCPRLNAALSTLESQGFMTAQAERLAADPELAAGYARAHQQYLDQRRAIAEVPEIAEVSAGGMPHRVKCLHALVAQSLASGNGVNPVGDAALEAVGPWWAGGCAEGVR